MNGKRKGRTRQLYCVWKNDEKDRLIALDEPIDVCCKLMGGIKQNTFLCYAWRGNKTWTVIRSNEIGEDETA